MSPEAQRIAIAEACGWTDVREEEFTDVDYDSRSISNWKVLTGKKPDGSRAAIPFYATDLNSIHSAEGCALNGRQYDDWYAYLSNIAMRDGCVSRDVAIECARASVEQRAEAFLRTLNLYTK